MASRVRLAEQCSGFDVGSLRGTGVGVTTPGSSTAVTGSVLVGGEVTLPLTPWLAITGELSVAALLVVPNFTVEGAGTVYVPSWLTARAALGVAVYF